MNKHAVVLLAIFTFLVASSRATAQDVKPAQGNAKVSKKLNDLLKQRRDTLLKIVKLKERAYNLGRVSMASIVHASLDLLKAELELAKDRPARIKIHRNRLTLLQLLEQRAKARYQAKLVAEEEVLEARAARMQAEIQLLREQLR